MLDGEPSTSEVTNAAGSGRSLQRTPTFRQPVQLPEGLASKYIERLADVLLRAGRSHRRLLESLVTEMVTEEEPLPSRRKVAELFAAEGLALPPLQMRRLLQHFSMNDDAAEEVDVFRLSAALDKAMFAAVALMGAAHKTSNTVAGSVIIAAQGPRAPKEPVLKSGAAEAKKSSSADISDEDREAIFQLVAQGLRAEGADSMIDLSALREVIVTMNLEMVKVGVGCTACYQDTGQGYKAPCWSLRSMHMRAQARPQEDAQTLAGRFTNATQRAELLKARRVMRSALEQQQIIAQALVHAACSVAMDLTAAREAEAEKAEAAGKARKDKAAAAAAASATPNGSPRAPLAPIRTSEQRPSVLSRLPSMARSGSGSLGSPALGSPAPGGSPRSMSLEGGQQEPGRAPLQPSPLAPTAGSARRTASGGTLPAVGEEAPSNGGGQQQDGDATDAQPPADGPTAEPGNAKQEGGKEEGEAQRPDITVLVTADGDSPAATQQQQAPMPGTVMAAEDAS